MTPCYAMLRNLPSQFPLPSSRSTPVPCPLKLQWYSALKLSLASPFSQILAPETLIKAVMFWRVNIDTLMTLAHSAIHVLYRYRCPYAPSRYHSPQHHRTRLYLSPLHGITMRFKSNRLEEHRDRESCQPCQSPRRR